MFDGMHTEGHSLEWDEGIPYGQCNHWSSITWEAFLHQIFEGNFIRSTITSLSLSCQLNVRILVCVHLCQYVFIDVCVCNVCVMVVSFITPKIRYDK